MLGSFLTAIDWFGTAVFAVTGALVASRKRMDITGFILLGCVTGMGGGTLRDALAPAGILGARAGLSGDLRFRVGGDLFPRAHPGVALPRAALARRRRARAVLRRRRGPRAHGRRERINRGRHGRRDCDLRRRDARYLGRRKPADPAKEIYVTAALAGAAAFVGLLALGIPAPSRRRPVCGVLRYPRARTALWLVAAGVPGAGRADDGGGGENEEGQGLTWTI